MKRAAVISMLICLAVVLIFLSQTAIDPENFSGKWYSSADQNVYLFQEGLIYSQQHAIPYSDTDSISGAYAYCKDSVLVFAAGIEGLEKEKELYLVREGEGSFLCESRDGTGKVYFIRYTE